MTTSRVIKEGFRKDMKIPNIVFSLTFKRKSRYYTYTLVVPTVIISMLTIVGLFTPSTGKITENVMTSFILRAVGMDRQEKVSMGLTSLLSVAIMLTIISAQMPKNPDQFSVLGTFAQVKLNAYRLLKLLFSEILNCSSKRL